MENREILENIIDDNVSDDNIKVIANYIKETNNLAKEEKFKEITSIEYNKETDSYVITYDNLYTVTIPKSNQTVGETIVGVNNLYNVELEEVLGNTDGTSHSYEGEITTRKPSKNNNGSRTNNTINVDFDLLEKITTTYDDTSISLSNSKRYARSNNLNGLLLDYYNGLGIDFNSEIDKIITEVNTLIENIQSSIIILMSTDEELGKELVNMIFNGDEETKENVQMYAYSADKETLTFDEYVALLKDSSEYCAEQRANYYEELKNNFAVSLYYLKTEQTPKLLNMIVESIYDAGVDTSVSRNGTEYQKGLIEFKNNLGEYILKDYNYMEHMFDDGDNVPDMTVWYSCKTKYDQALLYLSFQDNPISFFYEGLELYDFLDEKYPYNGENNTSIYQPAAYTDWSVENNIVSDFIDELYESYDALGKFPSYINDNNNMGALNDLADTIERFGKRVNKHFGSQYLYEKDGESMVQAAIELGYYDKSYLETYKKMSLEERETVDNYLCSYDFISNICENDTTKMTNLLENYLLWSNKYEGIDEYTDTSIKSVFNMTQCLNETYSIMLNPYDCYVNRMAIIDNYEKSMMDSLAERLDTSDISDKAVRAMRKELEDTNELLGHRGNYLEDYQIRAYIALKQKGETGYADTYKNKNLDDIIAAGKGFDEAKTYIEGVDELTDILTLNKFLPIEFILEPALMTLGGISNGVARSIRGVGNYFFPDGKKDAFDYKLYYMDQLLSGDYSIYGDYANEGNNDTIHKLLSDDYDYLIKRYPDLKEKIEKYTDKGLNNYEILYKLGISEIMNDSEYAKYCDLDKMIHKNPSDIAFYAKLDNNSLRGIDHVLYKGGEGVGNMAIAIALTYAGSHLGMPWLGFAGSAWMFASAAGEQKESMLQMGYSNDEWTNLYATVAGLTELVMETKLGGMPFISENANGVLSVFEGMSPKLALFCSNLARETWEENGENVITDIFGLIEGEFEDLIGYKGKNVKDLLPQNISEWIDRAWETTWQTLITTAMLNGANINTMMTDGIEEATIQEIANRCMNNPESINSMFSLMLLEYGKNNNYNTQSDFIEAFKNLDDNTETQIIDFYLENTDLIGSMELSLLWNESTLNENQKAQLIDLCKDNPELIQDGKILWNILKTCDDNEGAKIINYYLNNLNKIDSGILEYMYIANDIHKFVDENQIIEIIKNNMELITADNLSVFVDIEGVTDYALEHKELITSKNIARLYRSINSVDNFNTFFNLIKENPNLVTVDNIVDFNDTYMIQYGIDNNLYNIENIESVECYRYNEALIEYILNNNLITETTLDNILISDYEQRHLYYEYVLNYENIMKRYSSDMVKYYKNDVDTLRKIIAVDPEAAKFVSKEVLKNNPDILNIAIKYNPSLVRFSRFDFSLELAEKNNAKNNSLMEDLNDEQSYLIKKFDEVFRNTGSESDSEVLLRVEQAYMNAMTRNVGAENELRWLIAIKEKDPDFVFTNFDEKNSYYSKGLINLDSVSLLDDSIIYHESGHLFSDKLGKRKNYDAGQKIMDDVDMKKVEEVAKKVNGIIYQERKANLDKTKDDLDNCIIKRFGSLENYFAELAEEFKTMDADSIKSSLKTYKVSDNVIKEIIDTFVNDEQHALNVYVDAYYTGQILRLNSASVWAKNSGLSAVSDICDAISGGKFFSGTYINSEGENVIVLAGHGETYQSAKPMVEMESNFNSLVMLNDTEGLALIKEMSPELYEYLFDTYGDFYK